jgi:DNA invertase Pin-like site-specific DNA recombinase
VERFFEETASGGRWDRPELHRLLDQLRPEDVVVIWKLDRLSRSLKDLLAIMERIEGKHAGFRSLTEAVDTTIPVGRTMMQMVGAFAEFERAMIGERTRAGLAVAGTSSTPSSRRTSSTTSCPAGKPPRRGSASTTLARRPSRASLPLIAKPCCQDRLALPYN